MNRLGAKNREDVAREATLNVYRRVYKLKELLTEGGKFYGQVKLSPEMQLLKQQAAMMQQAMPPPVAPMPPEGMNNGLPTAAATEPIL